MTHVGEFLHKTYVQNHVDYYLPMFKKPQPQKRILSRECDSCLEWFDLDDEHDSIYCPECEAWIKEGKLTKEDCIKCGAGKCTIRHEAAMKCMGMDRCMGHGESKKKDCCKK